MANNLFPVFALPQTPEAVTPQVQKYRPGPLWDFAVGDFVLSGTGQPQYGTGRDEWITWCIKTIMTERFAYLAYSNRIGVESEAAFRQADQRAVETAFERTVSEALLADPMGRTIEVRNFEFDWNGDSLDITCMVYGADGDTAAIEVTLPAR